MGAGWIKKIIHYTWRPLLLWWLKKERKFVYGGISLVVRPGVFHPGFFFSSVLLADYISKTDLRQKKLLELGAGAGLLAIMAAKKGADVTATDISKTAVENIILNAKANQANVKVYHSDLFTSLPPLSFDLIIVNPPYYKKNPTTEAEHAWYCGEDLEYFRKLFKQAPPYLNDNASLYMILSEDCDISGIRSIAAANRFDMEEVLRKKKWWEYNYIYRLWKA